MAEKFTNKEIVEGILSRDERIIRYVYTKYRPKVITTIRRLKGSEPDAKDVFNEVLLNLYRKLKKEEIKIQDNFGGYLINSCKNRFIDKQRKNKNEIKLEDLDTYFADEAVDDNTPDYRILYKSFNELKEDCKEILEYRAEKISYKEIAEKMGFSGEQYAKMKRERCLKYFFKIYNMYMNNE